MKKKCALLLVLVLLASLLVSGMAYATGENGETEESGAPEETSAPEETAAETTPEETTADPKEALKEAMEKSPLGADAVIADGVYIDDVDVSGMTADQAMEAVLAHMEELGQKTLTLTLEGADDVAPIQVPIAQLGLKADGISEMVMEAVTLGKSGNLIVRYKSKKDLEQSNQKYDLAFSIDENTVKSFVTEQTAGLAVEPVNAELERSGSGFNVTQSQSGIEVNADTTAASIISALKNWNKEDVTVAAAAQVKQPSRTTEMLSQVQDVIGEFATSYSGGTGSGRGKNLKTGIRLTDAVLLMPGESWSMHDALVPFSAENGYDPAIAYNNGEYEQSYGGGICQLATTLYNAALKAEIYVSKRYNHSMIVGYTDVGLDATINDSGSKDLELTNDFDFPIYIEAYLGGGEVGYRIWGKETRPANRTLKFYGIYVEKEDSGEQVTIDPSLAPGQEVVDQATAYPKATAQAFKEIYVDGVLQEKILLHTDKYRASPRKVRRGPDAAATEAPTTAPTEAPTTPTEAPTEAPTAAPTEAPTTPAPTTEAPAPTENPSAES